MDIVGIEFDRTKFDSPISCEQWMRTCVNSDIIHLLDRKIFKLKSSSCIFLTDEKRKVWSWYQIWDSKEFRVERPIVDVVVVRRTPQAGLWFPTDIPTPLQATQEKRQKLEYQRQKRELKRRETVAKLKLKKKEKNLSQNPDGAKAKAIRPKKAEKTTKKRKTLAIVDITPPSIEVGMKAHLEDGIPLPPSIEEAIKNQEELDKQNPLLDENY